MTTASDGPSIESGLTGDVAGPGLVSPDALGGYPTGHRELLCYNEWLGGSSWQLKHPDLGYTMKKDAMGVLPAITVMKKEGLPGLPAEDTGGLRWFKHEHEVFQRLCCRDCRVSVWFSAAQSSSTCRQNFYCHATGKKGSQDIPLGSTSQSHSHGNYITCHRSQI
jgi:hypothetical protein